MDEFWESDAILSGLIVRNPAFQAMRTPGYLCTFLSAAALLAYHNREVVEQATFKWE